MKTSSLQHCVTVSAPIAFITMPIATAQAARCPRSRSAVAPMWSAAGFAMHRVSLKSTTAYWKFEHLAFNTAQTASLLRAWKDEGIEISAPAESGNICDSFNATSCHAADSSERLKVGFSFSSRIIAVQVETPAITSTACDNSESRRAETDHHDSLTLNWKMRPSHLPHSSLASANTSQEMTS